MDAARPDDGDDGVGADVVVMLGESLIWTVYEVVVQLAGAFCFPDVVVDSAFRVLFLTSKLLQEEELLYFS